MGMPDQTRNLNPTPEATVAMHLWGAEYAAQRGGSMDFWDKLSDQRRKRCETIVREVSEAAEKHNRTDLLQSPSRKG